MSMPNKQITDGNYRYNFQGQEKDPETGMEAFELRLWDGRLGRWNTIDPAGEFHSPYQGMGNNPINAIDPDGGDIIYLNDSNAVLGGTMGHAAVLIGNDKDGWRYLSMNGTGEGKVSSPFGYSRYADLGNKKASKDKDGIWRGNDFRGTGLTANEVIKFVNKSNLMEQDHHYDRAIRIKTSGFEDRIAYKAARKQANMKWYGIFGSSCIDVPQAALEAVVTNRLNIQSRRDPYFLGESGYHLDFFDANKYGFHILAPNDWYSGLLGGRFYDFMTNINSSLNNNFDYQEVHVSPRDY
jgi:RHS repeat-associated protein